MDKKEYILIFLGHDSKKYTKKQIETYIKDNVDEELKELELEGRIYIDQKGYISSFPNHLEIGRIIIQQKRAIVLNGKKKYTISLDNLNGALTNDLVIIKPLNRFIGNYRIATVDKVLKRDTGHIITEVKEHNGRLYLEDINGIIKIPIVVNHHDLEKYTIGDRLIVLIDKITNNKYYQGEIIDFVAHKDDPDIEIKTILVNNGFSLSFSDEAISEANYIPEIVRPKDLKGRIDLRKKLIFSIDGKYTKDRDDAISLEILPNGNYLLGVHISDVSYYVNPGMKLWEEAMDRATSVYPLNLVNPMFPPKLSNGICSLNEGVDRLTESTFIEIDPFGNIINHYSKSSVINSKKACTYDKVNQILEKKESVSGYEELEENLKLMEKVMILVRNKMIANGLLEFNVGDTEIIRDKNGNIIRIHNQKMGTAEKIIEFFMLITDMVKAEEAILPMVYRTHESPDATKMEETCLLLRKSIKNLKIPRRITCAKQIQNLLESIKDLPEEEFISKLLIQSMKRAKYSCDNIGHFALAVKGDIQYTSPIRRAGDLHNQYYMKLQRSNQRLSDTDLKRLYLQTYKLCAHLNQKEIAAEKVEAEAIELAMKQYLSKRITETHSGIITFLNNKLVLVKTEEGIECKLDLNNMYYYDKATNTYKHKHNKFKLVLGSAVAIIPKKKDNEIVFTIKK